MKLHELSTAVGNDGIVIDPVWFLYRSLQVLPPLKDYFKAIEVLKQSNLQWTVFLNGIFLDYFGPPGMKSYLKPNVFVIDLANRVAAIPGDGNTPVTWTYSFDLARFVVAALDLEEWPEESRVVGDEVTWNEFVALAEEITGIYADFGLIIRG